MLKAATAKERRRARQARFRRPLEGRADRRAAWVDLLANDHGVLRLAYRNRHRVSERLWRSAQPFPADLVLARAAGIATVLSLRGDGFGGDLLEREACARLGLAFERLTLHSRAAPSRETLREAIGRLPALAPPVLMHCKSGADRAGLGAALYLLIVEGRSAAEAKGQLALRFGHIRHGRTGVLDAFLDAYGSTGERDGKNFARWVEEVYDPDALTASFRTNRVADALLALMRRE